MKYSAIQRSQHGARRPAVLRISPIAAACSTLLLATAAYAQQQNPANLNVVTVTGIRGSIESSIAIKKGSDSIVEAISAEDIGKLPDVSIAESLARLPGLAAQRVDGRAQVISIRGLSPDFSATLLNGREQVSTGDNRGVEFDQYPSELINGATVYKTPDASLMGQGLSGTVNMKSVRPLDFKGRKVSVNVRGESNSNGTLNSDVSSTGNRLSFSYIDQLADNTVGIAIGFAHLDSPMQEKHYKAWWWDKSATPYASPTGDQAPGLGGFEAAARSSTQKRDGLMTVLEFKPNKDLHSTLDLYYSKFQTRKVEDYLLYDGFNTWNGSYKNLTSADGIVNSGTFTSTNANGIILQKDLTLRDDKLFALGWNTELKLANKWTAIADLSYSSAERQDHKLEAFAKSTGTDVTTFNLPAGGGFPTFKFGNDYADSSAFKLAEHWGRAGGSWNPSIKDDLSSLRLEAKRELDGFFSSFNAGLNYSQRNKSREYTENFFRLPGGTPATLSSDLLQAPANLAFVGIGNLLSYDLQGALNKFTTYQANVDDATFGRRWAVHEKITTGFAKLGIDTDLGKVPVRGNLGLQMVHADQLSDGYDVGRTASGAPVAQAVTKGTSYTDFLPSLNLVADLSGDRYLRFGLARTVARPRMDDMRAFNSAGLADKGPVDQKNPTGPHFYQWEGNGGNPELKPWVADSLDLSFEKYFGKRSYVAAAAFGKKLKTYIYNEVATVDYTGFPNQTGNVPSTNFGTFTRPVNGEGGIVRGIELSASLEGSLLSPMLDGFGVQFSGSNTTSDIMPDGPKGGSKPLPGMSGQVVNSTLYYEKSGFSARISNRHRSAFTAEITGLFANKSYTTTKADDQVDLQLGYNFESGTYKGLGLLLQINNLTDAAYETTQGAAGLPLEYNKFGRQVMFGITYKL